MTSFIRGISTTNSSSLNYFLSKKILIFLVFLRVLKTQLHPFLWSNFTGSTRDWNGSPHFRDKTAVSTMGNSKVTVSYFRKPLPIHHRRYYFYDFIHNITLTQQLTDGKKWGKRVPEPCVLLMVLPFPTSLISVSYL